MIAGLDPRNRHLLIHLYDETESKQESAVLLPENYEAPKSPYASARVLAIAPDVSQRVLAGEVIMVDRSMVNEVTFRGETYYLVLENYILGVIEREI